MPTLHHLDDSGNALKTEYGNAADCEKDLVRWSYSCDRLLRLSAHAVPSAFKYEQDPRASKDVAKGTHEEWQQKLFAEVAERKSAGDVLAVDLERFASAPCAQAIPGEFSTDLKGKRFLQLELLMLRDLEKANVPLSRYGANLKNAFTAAGGVLADETTITPERIDLIAKNDDRARWRAESQQSAIANDIRAIENNVVELKKEVERDQKSRDHFNEKERYLSPHGTPFHPTQIVMKMNDRAKKEKNLSVFDKVKLMAVRKLGRDEEVVFKDGLGALKKQLADHLEKVENRIAQNERETDARVTPLKQKIAEMESQVATKQAELAAVKVPEAIVRGQPLLDDEYARDVKRVMKQNNAFLVHSIASTSAFNGGQVCGENSPLLGNVTLAEKVQIARTFDPSLACSTFAPGDNATLREFSAPMGVLISGGRIDFMKSSDGGTRVDSRGNRFSAGRDAELSPIELAEQIESRRDAKGQDPAYDELAISKAQIAGVYLNVDRLARGDKSFPEDKAKVGEGVLSAASRIFLPTRELDGPDLPMYIILRGHMHQVTLKDRFFEELKDYDVIAREKQGKTLTGTLDEALDKIFHVGPRVMPEDLARDSGARLSAAEKVRFGPELVEKFQPALRDGMVAKLRGYADQVAIEGQSQRQEQVQNSKKAADRFFSMIGKPAAGTAPDPSKAAAHLA